MRETEPRDIYDSPQEALDDAARGDVIVAVTHYELWDPSELPGCTDDTFHAGQNLGHWARVGDRSRSETIKLLASFEAPPRRVTKKERGDLSFGDT